MINLVKYTYLMEPEKIKETLNKLWERYQLIINKNNPNWENINEARAILYLTGNIYCEKIAIEAIERRLHLLKIKLSLIEFLDLIDKDSDKLIWLRKDELFVKLEKYYRIVKDYKNKYIGGKYYLEEEKFLEKYKKSNPNKNLDINYSGNYGT